MTHWWKWKLSMHVLVCKTEPSGFGSFLLGSTCLSKRRSSFGCVLGFCIVRLLGSFLAGMGEKDFTESPN